MADLPPEMEQALADMDEGSWSALVAKVRAPDSREQLRTAAGQVLSGAALDAFVDSADPSRFTGDDGQISEERVMGRLTALFGTSHQDGSGQSWGQHSGNQPGSRPGDAGRIEATRRFRLNKRAEAVVPEEAGPSGPGAMGLAEAQRSSKFGAGGMAEARRRFGDQGGQR